MKPTFLRIGAVFIALLAVLDPALTSARPAKPLVAVLNGEGDETLERRVFEALERQFTVLHGLSEGASATILVGATVPDESMATGAPVFAVLPSARRPDFRIGHIEAPSPAQLNARARVNVHVPVVGAAGRELRIQLRMDGLIAGEQKAPVRTDSSIVVVAMSVAPGVGPHLLRATARLSGELASDSASFVMDVRDDRLPVLFFDTRPSWTSTFVRRTIERDARFAVTHRVLTSRGLSNTAGPAPVTLRDFESTQGFASIVVGAPDQLSDADVSGLDAFMRRRGGRVVLLMEGRTNAAIDRLSGASGWRGVQLAAPTPVTDAATVELLRGRELFWPVTPAPGATVHAFNIAPDSTRRPIVWSVPVGAGRLVVSGAVDAWHYRAGGAGGAGRSDSSGFDAFWSTTIAGHSLAAPAAVQVQVTPPSVIPGAEANVRVTVRETFLSDRDVRSARVHASLVSDRDSTPVRLWPGASPGVFTGKVVAPRTSGAYRLNVSAGVERATAHLLVDSVANLPRIDETEVVRGFVSSRGGVSIQEGDLNRLPGLVSSAVESVSRVETWHPMRSAWWIVPFALLLGVEWWWRRRNGLA